jgi:hypothetical protein
MNRFELLSSLALLTGGAVTTAALSGCQPHIGDHCVLNTDCSLQGQRVCDTSAVNGYCTVFNCIPDSCIDKAACVMFQGSVPGCAYDDYKSPARTGRTMCLEQCQRDSDCRQSDGYHCVDPRQPPWNGVIVDDVQTQLVCLALADYYDGGEPFTSDFDAGVCQSSGPEVPPIDAGVNLEDATPGGG